MDKRHVSKEIGDFQCRIRILEAVIQDRLHPDKTTFKSKRKSKPNWGWGEAAKLLCNQCTCVWLGLRPQPPRSHLVRKHILLEYSFKSKEHTKYVPVLNPIK